MARFIKIATRLRLVDDLKMLKITMSNTSSRNKLNPEINDHYNIFTRESQEYEHTEKDEAYRFTWGFFLESKDKTSGILKSFLTEIENLADKKVKIIRCDNGTEFKNRVMSEFYEQKGIKREFSTNSNDLVDGSLFDSSLKSASNDEPQPFSDAGKKDDEGVYNTTATHADFFGNETKVDMSNITTTYPVPSTPNTRIHKDHSLDHVIGDVQSGVLTRRMTKTTNKQGFISAIYKGKTHEDLHTCLFACFLSQEEPKKVIQALKDPSWIEAMNKKVERGFEDPEFPDRVYKVEKALYGLYQAPRAWYETLLLFIWTKWFSKEELCTEFEKLMHKKFQMSSIGELTFFLGLQVTQKDDGIFISKDKYVDEILKKFGFSTVKTASTPMETSKPLLKDENDEDVDVHLYRSMIGSLMYLTSSSPNIKFDAFCSKDSPFDLEAYTDSDYVGASLDMKSTTRCCQFLGSRLISWQCKKQTIAICCGQAKTINGEVQIQSLVDGKKVIVTKMSMRRALNLKDAEGTKCLPNVIIFEQLTLMGAKTTAWNEFSSTMVSAIICLATNQKFNFSKYIFDNMVKNLEGGVKFLMYPRFVQVFLDKKVEGMTKHKEIYVTHSHTKKVFANMKREGKGFSGRVTPLFQTMMVQAPEELEPITDEAVNQEYVPIHSNDPLLSGEDSLKLKELVKKLERRNKSRTLGLKRLRKVGRTARIESFEDEGLGAQEDASKQGRKIADLDADAEVVSTAKVTTVSATTTTIVELTLAQTLIEIKAAKPKAVTTAATTTTTAVIRPNARGVAKMIEPEKPLKKKHQILIDKEIAQKLQAQLNAELEEEEKLAKQREEDANIAEWDNVQARIDANYELAARLQAQEQEELTVEEKSKLFVELMDKRKKHFARLRAEEQR
ncbi:putative ribonuclease H-like domain-containing protein [Tanacetum coccineum]